MSIKKIPSVDLLTKTDKHQHHLANKIVFVTYQIHLAPLCLLKEGINHFRNIEHLSQL